MLMPPDDSALSLLSDYPLAAHNTFGIAATARFAARITHASQFEALHRDPRVANLPQLVLGGGSNVVFTRDFDGVVLLDEIAGRLVVREDDDAWYVEAGGGENWHAFVAWTLEHGMAGLENLALIPGTVGAAPIQNIGAYGLEMKAYFDSLVAVELATGRSERFDAARCAFGYRDSFFKREGRGRFAIVSVTFRLPKQWAPRLGYADVTRELDARGIAPDAATARDVFDAVVAIRRAKLPDPLVLGNAGSFFKNPVIDAAQFDALRPRAGSRVVSAAGRAGQARGRLADRPLRLEGARAGRGGRARPPGARARQSRRRDGGRRARAGAGDPGRRARPFRRRTRLEPVCL